MKQQETLCWRCRNVGKRICLWDDSKGSEPTPGWTAIPQILQVDKRIVQSYIVVDCPMVDLENIEPNRGRKQKEVLDEDLVESMIDAGFSTYKITQELCTSWDAVDAIRKRIEKKKRERESNAKL